jgi:hypothetical protein
MAGGVDQGRQEDGAPAASLAFECPLAELAGDEDLGAAVQRLDLPGELAGRFDLAHRPGLTICRHFYEGWTTGFEPATAWTTILEYWPSWLDECLAKLIRAALS